MDNGCEASGSRIEIQGCEVVQDVQVKRSDGDDVGHGQRLGPRARIDVSTNGKRWRDGTKLLEDLGATHVAGMDDEIRALQRVERLRAEQSVRVGDDSDGDRGPGHQNYGSVLMA